MCLEKGGINITYINDSGHASAAITVPVAELAQFFRLPDDMASEAGNR
jgi:hypothetical protein